MHGRVKVKAPKEIQEERAREERAVAKKFKDDLDKAWDKRKAKCYDEEALLITGRLLLQNADYQTIWNFRREIILHWKEFGLIEEVTESVTQHSLTTDSCADVSTPIGNDNIKPESIDCGDQIKDEVGDEKSNIDNKLPNVDNPNVRFLDMEKIYMDELKFTSSCLIKHPKSYGTWFHRHYIICLMADPPFKDEIKACNHFLDLDERNFHCWDYRRFICTYGKIDPQNELEFTQKKISQNFSNFSSFYYRSSLLTLAHQEGILNINNYWDNDYETISNAIFVDPNDQSPWFYHKWLLAADQFITYQQPEPESLLHKVILDTRNNIVIYQFHKPLHKSPFNEIVILDEHNQAISLNSIVWKKIGTLSSDIWYHNVENTQSIKQINLQFEEKHYTINPSALEEESSLRIELVSSVPRAKSLNPKSKLDQNKLNNLKLLLEIEPDNKWINLTMALISGGPDEKTFDKLISIDPLRTNYYQDQRSKQILENRLKDNLSTCKLTITGQQLTCLYLTNHLTHLRLLDLSNNSFVKLRKSFNSLVSLETLIMDNNRISKIDNDFELLTLKQLSLNSNCIKSYNYLEPINNCSSLEILELRENQLNPDEKISLSPKVKIIK